MYQLKRTISILTVSVVTGILFLGIVCPAAAKMSMNHSSCSEMGTQISSANPGIDCLNIHLNLSSYLLGILPELILFFGAAISALVLVFKFDVRRCLTRILLLILTRLRFYKNNYLTDVVPKFWKTFFAWLMLASNFTIAVHA